MTVSPVPLHGSIDAIPSKSSAHRSFICAACADSETMIFLPHSSVDIDTTIDCLRALGTTIEHENGHYTVIPASFPTSDPLLDCAESGSTLRFLLPVAAALCHNARFTGSGRLPERPIGELMDVMVRHGVRFDSDRLPFSISGSMESGEYTIAGDISSQYISGLLMALPILEGDSHITLTTHLESRGYVEMTLSTLDRFGIDVEGDEVGYSIKGSQRYRAPQNCIIEGDWSNAAFFLAAGALNDEMSVIGLDMASLQGDKAVIEILRRFGAKVDVVGDRVTVRAAHLKGCSIDVADIPDLVPILAVVASAAEGETRIYNAARLRLKESDRLRSVAEMLGAIGGDVEETADGLVIRGKALEGGEVHSYGDHRIVMSAAIAASLCSLPVTIIDAHAVEKSYPAFFEDLRKLGGVAHVV
ncbi:MAG: 3-phosphoshikimate 1-carboxyvinyltransferase [Actinobacteria bacterium]|nr:3-phosphoshikimate 1-carboxyvinyltransferase [Actinomycetota bacterium]